MDVEVCGVIPMLAVHNASQALEFYHKVFQATEISRLVTSQGKVEHSEIKIGQVHLMIADEFPGHNHAAKTLGGTPVMLYLYVDDVDKVIQRAINEGATLLRPIQELSHGDRVGKMEDPFGQVWMVATSKKLIKGIQQV